MKNVLQLFIWNKYQNIGGRNYEKRNIQITGNR